MKTHRNQKNNKKWLVVAVIVGLLLVGAGTAYALVGKNMQSNTTENSDNQSDETVIPPKEEQQKNDAEDKADYIDEQENNEATPPTSGSVKVLTRNEGDSVVISSEISNITSGTCTLTITSNGKTITETASIIYAPSYSTCAGFSISKARLAGSEWNITIEASSGELTATGTAVHAL